MITRLSKLKLNDTAIIRGFMVTQDGSQSLQLDVSKRLMEMGLLVGTPITILHEAPFGSPIAIQARGSLISLRREEAEHIEVEVNS